MTITRYERERESRTNFLLLLLSAAVLCCVVFVSCGAFVRHGSCGMRVLCECDPFEVELTLSSVREVSVCEV